MKKSTISFESSDLKATVGQTVIGSYDDHGIGEYLIVSKRKVSDRPFETFRYYIVWAFDDPKWAANWEAKQAAYRQRKAEGQAYRARLDEARKRFPELAAREANLRLRADQFSGQKRHRLVNRANRICGQMITKLDE